MSEHTPEPWVIGKYGRLLDWSGKKDVVIYGCSIGGGKEPEANARRIVAAVNACRGIETETLEYVDGVAREAVKNLGEDVSIIVKLTRERDEARAMVRELAAWIKKREWSEWDESIEAFVCPSCSRREEGRIDPGHAEWCELASLIAKAEAVS